MRDKTATLARWCGSRSDARNVQQQNPRFVVSRLKERRGVRGTHRCHVYLHGDRLRAPRLRETAAWRSCKPPLAKVRTSCVTGKPVELRVLVFCRSCSRKNRYQFSFLVRLEFDFLTSGTVVSACRQSASKRELVRQIIAVSQWFLARDFR